MTAYSLFVSKERFFIECAADFIIFSASIIVVPLVFAVRREESDEAIHGYKIYCPYLVFFS